MKTCAGVVTVAECCLGLASSVSLAVSRWFYEKWFSAMLFERLAPRGHFDSAVRESIEREAPARPAQVGSYGRLPPMTILETYEAALAAGRKAKRGKKTETIMNTMWNDLGDGTIKVFIEGARTLAMTWDSA